MNFTRRKRINRVNTRKRGGAQIEPLPQQRMGAFANASIPCFGTEEPFRLKNIMTDPQSVPDADIDVKYELVNLLSGGKSGAFIFLIKNKDVSVKNARCGV